MTATWRASLQRVVDEHGPIRGREAIRLVCPGADYPRRIALSAELARMARVGLIDRVARGLYDRAAVAVEDDDTPRRRLFPRQDLYGLMASAALDHGFTVSNEQLIGLFMHVMLLEERLVEVDGVFCDVCGCTERNPCEGGCGWAADRLCSACAELDDPTPLPADAARPPRRHAGPTSSPS